MIFMSNKNVLYAAPTQCMEREVPASVAVGKGSVYMKLPADLTL